MRDTTDFLYEAYGIFAIFTSAALGMYFIHQSSSSPNLIQALTYISPWLASNAKTLAWVAMGIVFVAAAAIPPVLMCRDSGEGGSRLAKFGFVALGVMILPSVGFLLWLGWFSTAGIAGG